MTRKKKLIAASLTLAALATPLLAASCDTIGGNPLDAICCKEFKPGTNMLTVDWGLGDGNLEFGAAMQAVGDFSATAQGMITDLGVACRGMAVDMGAAEDAVVEPDPNKNAVAWCKEAMKQLATIKAQVSIVIQPAKCEVSVSAKLDCEASCDVSAKCELTPAEITASCEPGKLSGQCSGKCTGSCEGSANLAVACNGKCDGTCEGTCMGGTANGGQCSGTCNGKCRGSCAVDGGAMASCEGTCSGSCDVDFKAPKCTGTFTPPMGKCEAKGSCEGSCDASASAKAECTPPAVDVEFTGNIDDKVAALKKWLPQMYLVIEGKLSLLVDQATAFADITGSFNIDPTSSAHALFCLPTAVDAIGNAGINVTATGSASVDIFAGVGIGG